MTRRLTTKEFMARIYAAWHGVEFSEKDVVRHSCDNQRCCKRFTVLGMPRTPNQAGRVARAASRYLRGVRQSF
jgi:hypothetical protein